MHKMIGLHFSMLNFSFSDFGDFVVTPNATFYHTLPTHDTDPNVRPESPLTIALPGIVTSTAPKSPTARPRNKSHSRNSSTEL